MSKSWRNRGPACSRTQRRRDPRRHRRLAEHLGRHRDPIHVLDHHHVEVFEHLEDAWRHARGRRGRGVATLVPPVDGEQLGRGPGDPHDESLGRRDLDEVVRVREPTRKLRSAQLAAAPDLDAPQDVVDRRHAALLTSGADQHVLSRRATARSPKTSTAVVRVGQARRHVRQSHVPAHGEPVGATPHAARRPPSRPPRPRPRRPAGSRRRRPDQGPQPPSGPGRTGAPAPRPHEVAALGIDEALEARFQRRVVRGQVGTEYRKPFSIRSAVETAVAADRPRRAPDRRRPADPRPARPGGLDGSSQPVSPAKLTAAPRRGPIPPGSSDRSSARNRPIQVRRTCVEDRGRCRPPERDDRQLLAGVAEGDVRKTTVDRDTAGASRGRSRQRRRR